MAQTEMILRLLNDGEKVGYEERVVIKGKMIIRQSELIEDFKFAHFNQLNILHDSYEQGTRQEDGRPWFEGDIIENIYGIVELKYDRMLYFEDGIGVAHIFDVKRNNKYIGNIHDGSNHLTNI